MPKINNVENKSPKYNPILNPKKDKVSNEFKTAAGVLAGAWALKKFPKITIIGLIGVGVLLGLTMKEVARSVERFPRRSREDLH